MSRRDKVSMPQSTAGITRYFDDYRSKIVFKPGHIILLISIVILLMIMLHSFGYSWFGLLRG